MLPYSVILKKNEKKYILFLIVLFTFLINPLAVQTALGQTVTLDELKAFPTAEGFGKNVTGGKDGVILKVTNLNDSGSGSLRAALEDNRAATIVFEVAGTILLNSFIRPKSNKTVAGETAFRNGGQGITIRMNPNRPYSSPLVATGGRANAFGNHIWRYIRFRRGQGVSGESSGDNFSPWGNAGRFIIDHCSFMFSTDQNVSFPSVDGYTVQNSITAFGLAYATHAYGTKHSKGSLTSDTPYSSWYRNLFSCNDDRNPLIQARSSGITRIELINNFFYNRGIFGVQLTTFNGGTFHADIIGNYWKDGPNSNRARYGMIWPAETTAQAGYEQYYRNPQWADQRVYVSGNLSPRRTSHNQDNWDILGRWDDSRNAPVTSKNQHQVLSRLNDGVSNDAITAAEDLQTDLLSDVGVSLYYDSFDSQAITFAVNGTGSIVNGNGYSGQNFPQVSSLGPHPNIQNMSFVPTDNNNDGIADDWANSHNVSNASQIIAVYDFGSYQVLNNAGYTALEIYLAYLAKDFDRMEQGNGNTTIPVTGLDIDLNSLDLNLGETASLTATIAPANATYQSIIWSSSNTAVATVDQNGNVTTVASGSATITATAASNSNISDTSAVVVNAGEPTEVWLEAECAIVGANWSLINNPSASGNRYLLPPTGNNPTQAPSDTGSIITYDFTASAGSYAIFARVLTPNATDDSFWIRVNGGTWFMWNKIPSNVNFAWNRVHDGNDVNAPLTFILSEGINSLEIAHREDGAGLDKVFITNTSTIPNGFGPADDTCVPDILVDSITVNPQQLDLEIDQTGNLSVNIAPANATNQSITWTSSDTAIATVDQNGNVTAIAEGSATITATANDGSNISNSALVNVSATPNILVEGITLNPQQLDLEINQAGNLSANITPANATNQSITWTSSDTAIATVDQNGNVTAIAVGSATITATANDGSGTSNTALVNVSAAPDILVEGITLNPQQLDLEINQVRSLTANIAPANAADQSVTWASSDATIATVDQNGNVTAVAEGNTTITVTANDGSGVSNTAQVNVSAAPAQDILVNAIALSPQQLDLEINQAQTFAVSILPADATNQSITWASSDATIATVDQNGNVTAVAEGSATITATANDGSGVSNTAQVTVSPAPDILVEGIALNLYEVALEVGQVGTLAANVTPANATNQSITWTTSDTTVATVDQNGNVTAIAEGIVTITVAANDGSGVSNSALVTVSPAPVQDILVQDIAINPYEVELEVGQVGTLAANISPVDATNQSITWTTSDTTVAMVDQNGTVTAVAEGSVAITATANDGSGTTGTALVTVSAAAPQYIPVNTITISPQELELEITQVQTLSASIVPANATNQSISWTSSDSTVATVDQNGNVTAISEGVATITATANDGSGTTGTALVTVSEELAQTILVEDISINPQGFTLEVGQGDNLNASVLPANATDRSITWASSDNTVATVDQNGNVTALSGGSASITATANDFSGIFDTVEIVVNESQALESKELWLEAECANVGSNWYIMDDTSASGGKYLLPPTGNNYDEVPTDTGSIISYNFTLSEGIYRIYARALTPGGSDDSFWVRLNGGDWLLWNQIPRDNGFEWNPIHDGNNANLPLTFNLLEGNNTLEIAHREDGAGLDKIFITNAATVPSGFGLLDETCSSETPEIDEDEQEATIDSEMISPVGVPELDPEEIFEKTSVYPNPTRGNTMVTFPEESNYTFFSLYSMNGVLVKEGKIENYQTELPLSLADMENGMYLLRLYTDMGEEIFKKIIKQ